MKRTGPTNSELQQLIRELRLLSHKEKVGVWRRIAEDLEKPTRQRRVVNLSHINFIASDKETVLVPGKVLAAGDVTRKWSIAAWQFSDQARQKVADAKGTCLSIQELMKKNPKGANVRIVG